MRDVLLALGLLLSTASQLRPGGSAIGPGEIFLAIWLLLMLCREVGRLGPRLTPALSLLVVFWALFAVALSLGSLAGLAIGDIHDPDLFMHDVKAYLFLAAISCLIVVELEAGRRLRRVAWLLAALGTAFLVLQLAKAWHLVDTLPIDPWYWDRFRGWSANPNQLAFLCAVLWLLSLHLAETANRLAERIAAVVCMILPIYVGRLTKSDTFSLVLVAAGSIYIALKLRSWLISRERRLTFRFAFACIAVLALPAILASAIPLGDTIAIEAQGLAKDMTKGTSADTAQTAQVRFHAWSEAIRRGFESGMLGLGPGPHLETPPVLVAGRLHEHEPKYVGHPAVNSTPNFEAHNTLLDLFTQGGLMAVLSFVGLGAAALVMTCRARLDALTTLLCGLVVFTTFHLFVRHPIFWFAVAFCLVAGAEARRTSTMQGWS